MVEDDGLHPVRDGRTVLVGAKKYWAKTRHPCPNCATPDTYLYVKSKQDSSSVLECPNCDQLVHKANLEIKI